MLNESSPDLFNEKGSSNVSFENINKKNTSMYEIMEPSGRPTLNNAWRNASNENFSLEEAMKKTTYEFKIILLGSISVGKTAILTRYIDNEFSDKSASTIKIDFKTKIININTNMVQAKLNIWDTCGDEKFRAITRQYYSNSQGILLVYDITNRESFDKIIEWVNEIRNNAPNDVVLFLVGNKIDLTSKRQISYQEGKKKADELGMLFREVSAKSGDNILVLFEEISEAMVHFIENSNEINEEKVNCVSLDGFEKHNQNEFIVKKKVCC
jgi:Ras-related protein Rab-1A